MISNDKKYKTFREICKDFVNIDFYRGRYCCDKKKVLLDNNDVVKSYLRIKASK